MTPLTVEGMVKRGRCLLCLPIQEGGGWASVAESNTSGKDAKESSTTSWLLGRSSKDQEGNSVLKRDARGLGSKHSDPQGRGKQGKQAQIPTSPPHFSSVEHVSAIIENATRPLSSEKPGPRERGTEPSAYLGGISGQESDNPSPPSKSQLSGCPSGQTIPKGCHIFARHGFTRGERGWQHLPHTNTLLLCRQHHTNLSLGYLSLSPPLEALLKGRDREKEGGFCHAAFSRERTVAATGYQENC